MVLHLRAQGLEEGDEHPLYALLWSMVDFTFTFTTELGKLVLLLFMYHVHLLRKLLVVG